MGRIFFITACLALAACSSPEDVAEDIAAPESAANTKAAGSAVVEAVAVNEESELYSFDYAYPAAAAAIPELKQQLDSEMASSRKQLQAQAREAQADARESGFPYNAFAVGAKWEVVADTPRFLSLSASHYSYTGGAHPNSGASSMIWDREARRRLQPLDFFASSDALFTAVAETYCSQLNAERKKRRDGEEFGSGDTFGACPDIDDLTVLLGSSNGKTFNRIGLIASPYVAGPYAEGAYEVTVPVTEAVMQAVQPAYRSAFSLR